MKTNQEILSLNKVKVYVIDIDGKILNYSYEPTTKEDIEESKSIVII